MILFRDQGLEYDRKEGKIKWKILGETIKNNWKWLCVILIMSGIFLGISLSSTYLYQLLMDYVYAKGSAGSRDLRNPVIRLFYLFLTKNQGSVKLLFFMIFLAGVMSALDLFRGKAFAIMSKKMDFAFMNDYIAKLFRVKVRDISSHMTGDYISRISDLASVRTIISGSLITLLININLFFIGSILLFRISAELLFIALLALLLYLGLALLLRRPYDLVYHSAMSAGAEMQTCLKESIQGIELIKTYGIGDRIRMHLMEKQKRFLEKCYRGDMLATYSTSGSILIEQVSNLIILFIGFEFVNSGKISLGQLMTFLMMQSVINDSAKGLLSIQQSIHNGSMAVERLKDIVGMEEEPENGITIDSIREIRIEDLGFSYFAGSPLFQHVSFSISGHKKIAVVGKNGCGKSTLLKLIMGTEDATSGHVYINDIEMQRLKKNKIWDKMVYIPQNPVLFAGTIEYNITFGMEYSENEIYTACSMAGLSDFLSRTPQGLDLYIDENATNLSLGQKQSIALARAFVRKPDVMILDEATSNLDIEREEMVVKNILHLSIPCVFVTHNSSIINMMDIVIRLE